MAEASEGVCAGVQEAWDESGEGASWMADLKGHRCAACFPQLWCYEQLGCEEGDYDSEQIPRSQDSGGRDHIRLEEGSGTVQGTEAAGEGGED